jgi:mono/diheme cytochrome c family protein
MGQLAGIVAGGVVLLLVVASCASQPTPSGGELFAANCASCHGRYAEGDGPIGADMARSIPDLRYLAARNDGVFPRARVEAIIDGRAIVAAHGGRQMPVWGDAFVRLDSATRSAQAHTAAKIDALIDYLVTIQKR